MSAPKQSNQSSGRKASKIYPLTGKLRLPALANRRLATTRTLVQQSSVRFQMSDPIAARSGHFGILRNVPEATFPRRAKSDPNGIRTRF